MAVPILRSGDTNEAVPRMKRALVWELVALGLRPVAEVIDLDSKTYGSTAEKGVRKFQAKKNLDVDGVVGEKTWRALGINEPVVDASVAATGGRVIASVEPRSDAPRELRTGVTVGTLVLAITLCTLLVSGAAYANTSHVETAVFAETSAADNVYKVPKIINVYSHRPVDIMPGGLNASTRPFANAFLWKNSVSSSQKFDLIYSSNNPNVFKIRARHSGLCLMLDFRAPYTNGTRVIQYYCNSPKIRSRWWYALRVEAPAPPGEPQSDYPYMLLLVNNFTGKCLDADNGAGGAPPKGAVLQQWDCISYLDDWNAGNQLWRDYE
jgi:Putative peptidoglycan binding domain